MQYGDSDGDNLQLEVTQMPQNGFMIKDSGKWLYFPNPHFNGEDTVKFRVFDGKLRSAEATLVLDIKPSNDASATHRPRESRFSTDQSSLFLCAPRRRPSSRGSK